MTQTVEAVYDGAVLRPETELRLEANTRVRLTVEVLREAETAPGEEVSLPVGLRAMPLTVEAAKKMVGILEDASYPTHAGKEMPTADPSTALA